MTARDAILARIREALGPAPAPVSVPRDYRQAGLGGVDTTERFADRAAEYRATVIRTTPEELAATIARTMRARGIRRVVVPEGLPAQWLADLGEGEMEHVADDPPLTPGELDALDGVITGCALAIAETGTIVLDAGPGQGRRALSLLPDYHLCVVRADQVVPDVPDAIARLEPRRPLTWISGPSATSDIELQRVEGVHGPRTLDVVLVGEAP